MTIEELTKKSDEQLEKLAEELQGSIEMMRHQAATLQLTKVRDIRVARKDLARVKTVLSLRNKEQQLAEQE